MPPITPPISPPAKAPQKAPARITANAPPVNTDAIPNAAIFLIKIIFPLINNVGHITVNTGSFFDKLFAVLLERFQRSNFLFLRL